jgi:hypothetical protein
MKARKESYFWLTPLMPVLVLCIVILFSWFQDHQIKALQSQKASYVQVYQTGYKDGLKEGIRRVQQSKGLPISEEP